jgi:hypothetical protein
MIRSLLAVGLIAGLAQAAPALKVKPPLYYPTRIGDTRVYEVRTPGGLVDEYVNTVTKVENKDGVAHVTLGIVDRGETSLWAEVDVSAGGVVRRTAAGQKMEPPEPVVKLPFKAGETWTYQKKSPGGGRTARKTFTLVAEEEVEVPAGKFQAIRIDEEWESNRGHVRSSQWHAPGVGLVKMTTVEGTTEMSTYVLKAFKPGK